MGALVLTEEREQVVTAGGDGMLRALDVSDSWHVCHWWGLWGGVGIMMREEFVCLLCADAYGWCTGVESQLQESVAVLYHRR